MSDSKPAAKPPIGRAADGSTFRVGDPVLIVGDVIDISDAFSETTIITVRVPERLGGAGFICFEDKKVAGLARKRP